MTQQLSDELLLAYLDGQLERAQAMGIAELAEDNPEVSRRLLRLKRTQSHLMEAFSAIRQEERAVPLDLQFPDFKPQSDMRAAPAVNAAPPLAAEPMAAPAAVPAHSGGGWRAPLFGLCVLAIGLGVGYGARALMTQPIAGPPKIEDRAAATAPATPNWIADVAKFHAFFPKETLTPHPDAITNPELIRFQLTKVSGKALVPPDFSRQGYSLVRGQAFNYPPQRMMQLTYASKTEAPLALYVVPGGENSAIVAATHDGFRSAGWGSSGVRFLIASQKNPDDLKVLAAIAQSQVTKKR